MKTLEPVGETLLAIFLSKSKKQNMEHISFDIETLGTQSGDVVLSIGMTALDIGAHIDSQEVLLSRSEKIIISLDDSLNLGFKVKADTLKWWLEQSPQAIGGTFNLKRNYLEDTVLSACQRITTFIKNIALSTKREVHVWGNGANFDIVMLEALFVKVGVSIPWEFWNVKCLRTLKNVALPNPADIFKNTLPHDCLADAISQANLLQAIYKNNPQLRVNGR